MQICPEQGWVFVVAGDTVQVYHTVKRQQKAFFDTLASKSYSSPQQRGEGAVFRTEIFIGNSPSQVLPNSDCSVVAVSNEADNDLVYGTVTLIRNLHQLPPKLTTIRTDGGWNDDYVLRKGLHMPLTKKALKYWDTLSPIASDVDFSQVLAEYQSSMLVRGESLAWNGPEETELLVNLQQNNGLIRIDVANNRALALAGYGLKDHGQVPIDINSDDGICDFRTYPGLFSLRSPDTVNTLRYNGKLYLLTANEGDDLEFGDYEEAIEAADLFQVNTISCCCIIGIP